ncbi:MAG: GntR family transcriptional regulator [Lachnospiraceae bacterium]
MSEDGHSLSARVFHTLREDILSGKYRKDEELKEKNIGEELGVSRTPVREALRQLELEGLVTIIPNKGAFVVGISKDDIQDIYEIRSLLEGLCAKWAASVISEKQIEELEEIIFLTDFHIEKEHYKQILELDNRFHEILYEASSSKVLNHVLSDFHHYVERVRKVSLSDKKRAKESNAEHRKIVEALKAHDKKKAEKLANEHIMNTIQSYNTYGWDKLLNATNMEV